MKTLEQNEAIIANGLKSYVTVGAALDEIKTNTLYTKKYGQGVGWASYLKQRWNMTTDYARKLIEASKIAAILVKAGVKANDLPKSEGAVRKIAKKATKKVGKKASKSKKESALVESLRELANDSKTVAKGKVVNITELEYFNRFELDLEKKLTEYSHHVDANKLVLRAQKFMTNWLIQYNKPTKKVA